MTALLMDAQIHHFLLFVAQGRVSTLRNLFLEVATTMVVVAHVTQMVVMVVVDTLVAVVFQVLVVVTALTMVEAIFLDLQVEVVLIQVPMVKLMALLVVFFKDITKSLP